VCRLFAEGGAAVIDADQIARELVMPGQAALSEIVAHFGDSVIDADGHLDRIALRTRVFSQATDRRALENILHPRIQTALQRHCLQAATPLVVVAIPLLTPASRATAYAWLHRVLLVEAPWALQLARIMARDGSTPDLAEAMLAAQLRPKERLPMADDVLLNDAEPALLHQQAQRLLRHYLALAAD
jgi:dephospho-CoA kinase